MRGIFIYILVAFIATSLFSQELYEEVEYFPNIAIICFDADTIGSTIGDIDVEKNAAGQVQIGYKFFDDISIEYNFREIIRMFDVKNDKWHDSNGANLNTHDTEYLASFYVVDASYHFKEEL